MRSVPLGAAWLAASVAACSGDAGESVVGTQGLPAFSLTEELRIDGYEENLTPIDTAVRLAVTPDGTIAIAQNQDAAVRFFTADGEPLHSIGRRGEGPGEFTNLWRLGWMGDTLYAYDFSQRRYTIISPELAYVRYIHVPNGARPSEGLADRLPAFSTVYGAALYADGSLYGEVAGPIGDDLKTYVPGERVYGQVAEDGTILSYVQFTRQSVDIELSMDGRTLRGSIAHPLPTHLLLKLSDDGRRMTYVRTFVEGPQAGTFEVTVEQIGGDTTYVRSYPFELRPVPEALADSLRNIDFGDNAPPGIGDAYREALTLPVALAPVVAVLPGIDGSTWLRMRDTPEGPLYRVHDDTGEPLGTVQLPSHQTIAIASLERVWILERDEYDVESVVRYGVSRGDGPIL